MTVLQTKTTVTVYIWSKQLRLLVLVLLLGFLPNDTQPNYLIFLQVHRIPPISVTEQSNSGITYLALVLPRSDLHPYGNYYTHHYQIMADCKHGATPRRRNNGCSLPAHFLGVVLAFTSGYPVFASTLLFKAKRQYLFTLQVSGYCLLSLQSKTYIRTFVSCGSNNLELRSA